MEIDVTQASTIEADVAEQKEVTPERVAVILGGMNIDLNIAILTDLAETLECNQFPTVAKIARSGAHALVLCEERIAQLEMELAVARSSKTDGN